METWDAVRSRRNVRTYTDQPIASGDLDLILEAGRRSPSSSNQQRWDFVVVTERPQLEDLSHVWQGARHVAQSAATVGIVAPIATDEYGSRSTQYDLGQTTMCMMLAATDLGIGSAHAKVDDQELARKLLGFPDDHELAWLVAFGYPADRPLRPIQNPNRRPFERIVHRGHW